MLRLLLRSRRDFYRKLVVPFRGVPDERGKGDKWGRRGQREARQQPSTIMPLKFFMRSAQNEAATDLLLVLARYLAAFPFTGYNCCCKTTAVPPDNIWAA